LQHAVQIILGKIWGFVPDIVFCTQFYATFELPDLPSSYFPASELQDPVPRVLKKNLNVSEFFGRADCQN